MTTVELLSSEFLYTRTVLRPNAGTADSDCRAGRSDAIEIINGSMRHVRIEAPTMSVALLPEFFDRHFSFVLSLRQQPELEKSFEILCQNIALEIYGVARA